MKTAYIGLGSNLADPQQQVVDALKQIDRDPELELRQCSSLYLSKALTLNDENQPDYINAVARIGTELSAEELLDKLQAIENSQGRVRQGKWGARTLDLDILLFAQEVYQTERLQIPHPHMAKREFVLYPLNEIEPDLEIPNIGPLSIIIQSVSENGLIKLD